MFNILITDDEQIVIDSLSFIISKNFADEAKVFTALSGTEAIEIVMKENIDMIFMDINTHQVPSPPLAIASSEASVPVSTTCLQEMAISL